ncbi:MAG: cyclic pyranopterin monophosphate synthase MoaC [Candidatus Bipolaricaulota bacterium]|nr:cyclic pyranopterin monophosphate synthase MoaC [Candidatus Bipolaricaulota bacterium]MCS7273988.1 cyclic pyranopterin monophosphate synthase MoaC [Candidatus Bipolaricaulota bacterium]MDW8111341.1 cyclic pyranopterin monophosphate synthase MoaC [Candidatus Bipolaricaulota bacterium]MDW8329239.1 cyclic pyranopterin monophosphate synthase MoaC [Candidatus Bipolaricaulota bacterium]
MSQKSKKLSHLDAQGRARMVDVSDKPDTKRVAIAQGAIAMSPQTLRLITTDKIAKGDVLTVAKLAGVMGAKKTSDLIPLCHPIPLDAIDLEFQPDLKTGRLTVTATATSTGKTGVEMEALTACAVALLTVYDMCKSAERGMVIEEIKLLEKRGGRSGLWKREL